MIELQVSPDRYHHWKLSFDGAVATLALDVAEDAGLIPGYELKLNSYDLGVDIELNDALQRLRFEHPEVGSVIITSAKDRIFCAGANIKALGQASHSFKVNFCKFTNETRNAIEDATRNSGQTYITAINGACAGGGYELALATDYILMADDGATGVSLPEIPLLAVLPGTGGLTRLVDKRKVRRDRADFFCTTEEGMRGKRAVEWRLVDEVVPRTKLAEAARRKALEAADRSPRPRGARGCALTPLTRGLGENLIRYQYVKVEIDRTFAVAHLTVHGPASPPPSSSEQIHSHGDGFWPLALARELEDAIFHLRFNEESIGTWVIRSEGDARLVQAYDRVLLDHAGDWLVREIMLYLKRTLARLDVTSRSMFALVEPGSCFTGTLLELALAADRIYMLNGRRESDELAPAAVELTGVNFGAVPMCNGLSRLQTRFLDDAARVEALRGTIGERLEADEADALGLVTFAPDDIDWDDEVRLAIEERAAFSPDALTGMEASLRFAGPETLETKIFARLSAWQNWIFQRPNAVGEKGALKLYGTGQGAEFDSRRV
ncbi:MAG: 2,3-epoxybenzoyl-CoA dihydrolase [Candidatus Binataceae bacterium]